MFSKMAKGQLIALTTILRMNTAKAREKASRQSVEEIMALNHNSLLKYSYSERSNYIGKDY